MFLTSENQKIAGFDPLKIEQPQLDVNNLSCSTLKCFLLFQELPQGCHCLVNRSDTDLVITSIAMARVGRSSCEVCCHPADLLSGCAKLHGTLMNASGTPLINLVSSVLAFPSSWAPSLDALVCSSCFLVISEIDFHRSQSGMKEMVLREKFREKVSTDMFTDCVRCGGVDLEKDGTTKGYELKPYRYNVCNLCGTSCPSPDEATVHFATYHPGLASHTFMCFFCLAGFPSYSDLSTHVLLSHIRDDRTDGEVGESRCRLLSMCRLCGAHEHSPSFLREHFFLNHPESVPYLCPACGKGFSALHDYENHLRHEGQRLLNDNYNAQDVDWDGISWPDLDDYTNFPQRENAEETVGAEPWESQLEEVIAVAEQSQETFVEVQNILEDQSDHSDRQENFHSAGGKCPVCAVPIPDKEMPKHAKDVHLASYIKKCVADSCGRWFIAFSEYRKHQRTVHGKSGEKCRDKVCEYCGAAFGRKRDLDAHMLTKHQIHVENRPKFPCSICGKAFARKDKLAEHVRVHEKIKSFPCPVCHHKATQRGHLTMHMRRKHPTTVVNTV